MEVSSWLINVFVGIMVSVVYAREYLRGSGVLFKKPERAVVRVVDPHILYTRRGRTRD